MIVSTTVLYPLRYVDLEPGAGARRTGVNVKCVVELHYPLSGNIDVLYRIDRPLPAPGAGPRPARAVRGVQVHTPARHAAQSVPVPPVGSAQRADEAEAGTSNVDRGEAVDPARARSLQLRSCLVSVVCTP